MDTGLTRIETKENRYSLTNESVEEVIDMIRYANKHPEQAVITGKEVSK